MKKLSLQAYLFGIPMLIFLGFFIYFTVNPVYGYTSPNSEGSTKYWTYTESHPECGYPDSEAKRPVVTVHSVSSVYYRTLLGGHGDESDVSDWHRRQGNCPYQVTDIYKSGVPLDFLIMAAAFGAALYVSRDRSKS